MLNARINEKRVWYALYEGEVPAVEAGVELDRMARIPIHVVA